MSFLLLLYFSWTSIWFSTWLFPFPDVHPSLSTKPTWLLSLAGLGFFQSCCYHEIAHISLRAFLCQTVLPVCDMFYWKLGLVHPENLNSSVPCLWAEVRSLVCGPQGLCGIPFSSWPWLSAQNHSTSHLSCRKRLLIHKYIFIPTSPL